MENLKAVVTGYEVTDYQRALAIRELERLTEQMYLNMQYYMEYCLSEGYVTPHEWLEKHKHF